MERGCKNVKTSLEKKTFVVFSSISCLYVCIEKKKRRRLITYFEKRLHLPQFRAVERSENPMGGGGGGSTLRSLIQGEALIKG